MPSKRLWIITLLLVPACAGHPPPSVDLTAARAATAAAREAGAEAGAPEELRLAEAHVAEAEALLAQKDHTRVPRAEMLAALAVTQARLAAAVARAASSPPAAPRPRAPDAAALRRLEGQVELLMRELEMADAEIMRSRAKGIDTKAEASSAIAESRILIGRASRDRSRASEVARCRELIDNAEKELDRQSFGAARWLALKCQRLLDDTRRPNDGTTPPPAR